jgi:hypothetical protein
MLSNRKKITIHFFVSFLSIEVYCHTKQNKTKKGVFVALNFFFVSPKGK